MSDQLDNYSFIRKLIDKHRLALQNKSKDVRFTIEELNDIIMDITTLSLSISEKKQNYEELQGLIQSLLKELKSLTRTMNDNSEIADGGRF